MLILKIKFGEEELEKFIIPKKVSGLEKIMDIGRGRAF